MQDRLISVAPPTQGTWRSNDYVSAVRLVDMVSSREWVGELIIYIWSGVIDMNHTCHHIPTSRSKHQFNE